MKHDRNRRVARALNATIGEFDYDLAHQLAFPEGQDQGDSDEAPWNAEPQAIEDSDLVPLLFDGTCTHCHHSTKVNGLGVCFNCFELSDEEPYDANTVMHVAIPKPPRRPTAVLDDDEDLPF